MLRFSFVGVGMNHKNLLLDYNYGKGPGNLMGSCFSSASDIAKQLAFSFGVPALIHKHRLHDLLIKTPMLSLRKYLLGILDESIYKSDLRRLQGRGSEFRDVSCDSKVSICHDVTLDIVGLLCWLFSEMLLCFSFFRFGNISLLSCARFLCSVYCTFLDILGLRQFSLARASGWFFLMLSKLHGLPVLLFDFYNSFLSDYGNDICVLRDGVVPSFFDKLWDLLLLAQWRLIWPYGNLIRLRLLTQ